MESTGSYWQTLFSALQCCGFKVILVDGKQTKNLKKKTDVKDARAIYQLHSLGLLSGCFLPDQLTEQIRVYHRHRSNLIRESSRLSNRMQQAMRLMNIRLVYQALSNEPHRQSYFSSDQGGKTGVMPKHNAFMSRHSSSGRIFPTPSRRKRTSLWESGFSAWCTRLSLSKILASKNQSKYSL